MTHPASEKTMILPDVLKPGLKIVFCGTAVGNKSARRKAYYADPNNQFWPVLRRIGLTPRQLLPEEFPKLLDYGIGLTDLVKISSGSDNVFRSEDFDTPGFKEKINKFSPKVLAFNGKKAGAVFLGRQVKYGLQAETIGQTKIFVLPSTSGAARGFWDERRWQELASLVQKK